MSKNRQRDTHLDASDLLDENGNVDRSRLWSAVNAANAASKTITPDRCATIRERVLDTQHAGKTADAMDHGHTAVRRHAKGECHHMDRQVDHPPLTHERGAGWRAADE